MKFKRAVLSAGLLAVFCASAASAAERETFSAAPGGARVKQLQTFLFPEAECENVTYQCLAVRPTSERSVGMDVRFQTGSSELTPQARSQLEPWGKVLATRKGKLNAGEIVIEGHADARGTPEFNKALSQRRAEAVVKHLVSSYGVDSKVLKPVGHGKDRLKDASHPESEVNRRVELVRKPN